MGNCLSCLKRRGGNGSAEVGQTQSTNPVFGRQHHVSQNLPSNSDHGEDEINQQSDRQHDVPQNLPSNSGHGKDEIIQPSDRQHDVAQNLPSSGGHVEGETSTPTKTKAPPTLEEVIAQFGAVNSRSLIDELINEIKQLLERQKQLQAKKRAKGEASTSSQTKPKTEKWSLSVSFIKSGATFLKFCSEHIEKIGKKGDGRAIAKEILQLVGNTHWIVAVLSVTAYLLDKFDKVSANQYECLQLLESMVNLANHIKILNNEIPEEGQKLEKAVEFIVEGSIICASQLHSKSLFRFLKSSVNFENLNKLRAELEGFYHELTLTVAVATKHQQPGFLPLSQPPKPDHAVGIEQPLKKVMDLMDMTSKEESSLAVVIYGYGGIGKTTLATAVVASLDIKGTYNYTRVEMDQLPDKNDLRRMQQQILTDAFPEYNHGKPIILRDCIEGRERLTEAFECAGNKPVFIFIDNSLREKDLRELLPEELHGLPHRSRILLTTRNLRVTDMLERGGLQRRDYPVQTLPREEALKILLKKPINVDLHSMEDDLERLVKVCDGIPLVLQIVGARLRKHKYRVEGCSQLVEALEKGKNIKEYDLSERLVDFVYGELEESTQDAFLDICCFFNNWNRRYVEYIVGTEHVTSLEEAALLSTSETTNLMPEIVLRVHDVIRAKGRRMSGETRIMNVKSFNEVKDDEAKLKEIKGLWLMQDDTNSINYSLECLIEERQLNLMKKTLRVLALGERVSMGGGRSEKTFEELRYLQIGGDHDIPVRLEAQHRLAVYYGPLFKQDVNLNQLPKNLVMLRARGQRVWDPNPIQAVKSYSLKEINLTELGDMPMTEVRLDYLISILKRNVSTLESLILDDWTQMKEFPEQVCGLRSLTRLSMNGWRASMLPESFGHLTSLTHLSLTQYISLKTLPLSFGQLTSLTHLSLLGCISLKTLPLSFGQLTSLTHLNLYYCLALIELPTSFDRLTSLRHLYLYGCRILLEKSASTSMQLKSLKRLNSAVEIHDFKLVE